MRRSLGLLLGLSLLTAFSLPAQERSKPRKRASASAFDIRDFPNLTGQTAAATDERTARAAGLPAILATLQEETNAPLRHTVGRFGAIRTLAASGGFLTSRAPGSAASIVRAYVAKTPGLFGLNAQQVAALAVEERQSGAFRTVTLTQQVEGVRVFRGSLNAVVDVQGRVLRISSGNLISAPRAAGEFVLTPSQAIARAYGLTGPKSAQAIAPTGETAGPWTLFENPVSPGATPAALERTIFPLASGHGVAAYRVLVYGSSSAADVVIDAASGRTLFSRSLGRAFSMNVWPESPLAGPRETIDIPADYLSPDGTSTDGRFVRAFRDLDGDDLPDPGAFGGLREGFAYDADGDFSFQAGNGISNPLEYPAHAVTSASFHANRALERFRDLGFGALTGGFAVNDDIPGGAEGDPVEVHVQDGLARDSWFIPAPDGLSPKMELAFYRFPDGSASDHALSSMVVTHEMTHGVMERTIGGPTDVSCTSGPIQSGSLSEGTADYFSASFANNPIIGAYAAANPELGIRRYRLDQNPLTFADFLDPNNSIHNNGEIWAATLWDARTALGAEVMDQLVYSSFAIMPCDSTFVDARDAILEADTALNESANNRTLWEIFAARGLGASASADHSGQGGHETLLNTANDLPGRYGDGNAAPTVTSSPGELAFSNRTTFYQLSFFDLDQDAVTVEMTDAPEGATFTPEANQVTWRPGFVGGRFEFTLTDARGAETVHIFYWISVSVMNVGRTRTVSGPMGSNGYVFVNLEDPADFLQFTLRGGSGDPDLNLQGVFTSFAPGPDETITLPDFPGGLTFLVIVEGYGDYEGVAFSAQAITPTTLSTALPSGPYDGVLTSERLFKLDVEPGTEYLRVQVRPEMGDADLLAALEDLPSCQTFANTGCVYDEASLNFGGYESLELENPEPGEWIFTLHGWDPFEGAVVEVSDERPPFSLSGVTDAAGFTSFETAVGGITTLFGAGFTEGVHQAESLPIPTELDGLELFVNGYPAGQFFLNGTQSNFQFPLEAGAGLFDIVGVKNGVVSHRLTGTAYPDLPRLFTFALDGMTLPVVIHANGSAVTPDNPARPGETLIAYLTGLSSVANLPASGEAAGADPLTTSLLETTVDVGDTSSPALFSGWAPGFVALVQVNFTVDVDVASGFQRFVIHFGDLFTQELEIPITRE